VKGRLPVSKSAYIKLVPGSKQSEITLDEVKQLLNYYQEMTQYTGKQLAWDYADAAFPYQLSEQEEAGRKYLLLEGHEPHLYHHLLFGVGEMDGVPHIQLVLPERGTHGDNAKANELSRFLAKQLQAELQMLNGRTMYFYKRK
jgi:hypothetical protein